MTRRISCLAVLLTGCFVAGPVTTTQAQAPTVVLGAATYAPNGSGFGTAQPASFFNGGSPSGLVEQITWSNWGTATATGNGRLPLFKPQGGYFSKTGKVKLRATGVGICPGQPLLAYTQLSFRAPPWPGGPRGAWRKWSGTQTICDFNVKDPSYQYPKRPPGDCGQIGGGDYTPGDLVDIQAYRVSCKRARRVARRNRSRHRDCSKIKCVTRRTKFRCRWQGLRSGETTSSFGPGYPVQRVSCRRGQSTLSWWHVVG